MAPSPCFSASLSVTTSRHSTSVGSHQRQSGGSIIGTTWTEPSNAATPGNRVGASPSYGPYLQDALNPQLPAGNRATDYRQRLGMVDVEVMAGHFEVRGEGAFNVWETPTVMASTSDGATCAWSSAAVDTRAIRDSTSGSSSFPKGVWAQPTMTARLDMESISER